MKWRSKWPFTSTLVDVLILAAAFCDDEHSATFHEEIWANWRVTSYRITIGFCKLSLTVLLNVFYVRFYFRKSTFLRCVTLWTVVNTHHVVLQVIRICHLMVSGHLCNLHKCVILDFSQYLCDIFSATFYVLKYWKKLTLYIVCWISFYYSTNLSISSGITSCNTCDVELDFSWDDVSMSRYNNSRYRGQLVELGNFAILFV